MCRASPQRDVGSSGRRHNLREASGKFQTSNSKLQRNSKFQIRNGEGSGSARVLAVGVWGFSGAWRLELGAFSQGLILVWRPEWCGAGGRTEWGDRNLFFSRRGQLL